MTEEEQQLYDRVPLDGSTITNPELQRQLGWDRDRYWNVRNALIDRGSLSVARGRGGLVFRVILPEAPAQAGALEPQPEVPPQIREDDLYQPISAVLNQEWAREKRLERWIVHTTARQGRRDTGGRWSRPDLVLATQSTYPYVPGRHFDVITFEVKPSDSIDVTAVYEALAHRRAATKAYVVLHVPDANAERLNDTLTEVYSEAKRHGVGVIIFNQPGEFAGWEEMVEPIRQEPDPRRLNDFLTNQFESTQLETILRWFR
ncbi:hypothetical protein EYS42_16635 [Aquabacterium lacunae]|uniref:Uncharacterized protein n=1 Tax=Aquabacterium lacunae TaxID=2528630 RepID=A0A4Q9GYM5_9BURK|nr:hypothetical protein [Aquabacterium lacunae]TBO27594.1 hypothetical protein EYS42_16635 [Aquabacterium lacunae]